MSSLFGKFEGFRFSHLSWQKALQLGMPEVGHSCSVLIALQPLSLLSGSSLDPEDHGSSAARHHLPALGWMGTHLGESHLSMSTGLLMGCWAGQHLSSRRCCPGHDGGFLQQKGPRLQEVLKGWLRGDGQAGRGLLAAAASPGFGPGPTAALGPTELGTTQTLTPSHPTMPWRPWALFPQPSADTGENSEWDPLYSLHPARQTLCPHSCLLRNS